MPMNPLHILKAGTFTDMHGQQVSLTDADLAGIAASYDAEKAPAPIVVGHPQHNSPAFGWLSSLSADADGLTAAPDQVDPAFADAVRAGRYRRISASLYPPTHASNPKPGSWYLRHVGFLGGAAPAVQGLRGADLADDDEGIVTVELGAEPETDPVHEPTQDELPLPQPPEQPMPDTEDTSAAVAALAAREANLTAREAAIAAREQAAADQAAAIRRAEVTAFVESLANQAKMRPDDVSRVTEIILALDDARPDAIVAFAESDSANPRTAAEWLRARLADREPLIELGEVATKGRAGGANAGKSDDAIASRARAIQHEYRSRGESISAAQAVAMAEAE